MISFILDSNVWEKAICPEDYSDGKDYILLNQKINNATDAEFYLSATIFDLENICRNDRLSELKAYKPCFETKMVLSNDIGGMTLTIGPDSLQYKPNPKLSKHAMMAFDAGFKVVASPRIGIPPINHIRDIASISITEQQNNSIADAGEFIEKELKAGMAALYTVFDKYGVAYGENLLATIRKLPNKANNEFAAAVAEWADGDTVAACIGMEIDYLVTNDTAGNAGSKSIFYKDNIQRLKAKYTNFNVITSQEMVELL